MNSVAKTADQITSQLRDQAMDQVKDVKETVNHAKGSLLDFGTQILKFANNVRAMETRGVDQLLDRVGLQRQTTNILGPAAWFAAGAVAGGTTALFFAPSSGKKLRERVSQWLDRDPSAIVKDAVKSAKEMEQNVESKVSSKIDSIKNAAQHMGSEMESKMDDVKDGKRDANRNGAKEMNR